MIPTWWRSFPPETLPRPYAGYILDANNRHILGHGAIRVLHLTNSSFTKQERAVRQSGVLYPRSASTVFESAE